VLTYDEIAQLRDRHPAWRLLRATNAPLVVAFLGRVFVEENVRTIARQELVTRLDDELYALRATHGEESFPKSPAAYLTDWAGPEQGWLRMYYPAGSDDPHLDATPALERAVAWVEGLQERAFVGTESRLETLVGLLRRIAEGTDSDPERHLDRLLRQRAELDAQIERARAGSVDLLDDTAVRDRYQQFAANARELLADFREVEAKFRALDRELRETIATWDDSKGTLLDHVLGDRNVITDSDQGRSFIAFYDFLLSPVRQEELARLLDQVHALSTVDADPRVRRIDHDWLSAADRTQATVRQLSDQLRRFLDDRVWLENRRVIDLLRSIEARSLAARRHDVDVTMELDAVRTQVTLPLERPLYVRPAPPEIDSTIAAAEAVADPEQLFAQSHVDQARITAAVLAALGHRRQVSLSELVDGHPVEQGLAEIVAYLGLDADDVAVVFDAERPVELRWTGADGEQRYAVMPTALFVRAAGGPAGGPTGVALEEA
jgi:flagellar motility protein MotE (MotC chaperone)